MSRRNVASEFGLTSEDKKKLLEEIKHFFSEERGEDLGIIASENVLDFFLDTMGRQIYDKALNDAKYWFQRQMENIESDYYSNYKG